ncbi:MAG: leucyl/phenylalanyl-tRNA--protein transferase [Tepidiformaceae bacterium]
MSTLHEGYRGFKVPRMDAWLPDSSGRPAPLEIDVRTASPPAQLPPCPWTFPDPRLAEDHGLIGEGADFAPATVIAAYRRGIFPWPHGETEYLWFSPNPRAIIPLDGLHISRRLARTVRSGKFHVSIDGAFEDVILACAECRDDGTWITPALMDGYCDLHRLGWAHSVEVWNQQDELVGGLYGIGIGAMFGAESMFSRERDASKVAMVALLQHARTIGIQLIDVQVLTDHTERMGAVEISRDEYLDRLKSAVESRVAWT